MSESSGTGSSPSPRLAARRARAMSTSTRRIMRAVVEKKCARFCQWMTRQSSSRKYSSWTRSVGCQSSARRSRASSRLAMSRSRPCTSGASRSSAFASPLAPGLEQFGQIGVPVHPPDCKSEPQTARSEPLHSSAPDFASTDRRARSPRPGRGFRRTAQARNLAAPAASSMKEAICVERVWQPWQSSEWSCSSVRRDPAPDPRGTRTGSPRGAARPRFAAPMAFRFRAPGPRRHQRRLAQSRR